ncbi:MAG: retinol dehydrogenase [Chloroflexota bacterium]|nr:MAG: retinol dehydrogenase [Chloroflexota bacterium]
MTSDMTGKICLITGASSGIGKETVLGLAQLGATVVMHGHNPTRSQAALDYVRSTSGNPNIELIQADLSQKSGIQHLADTFKAKYSRLDVLLNNAGMLRTSYQTTPDGLEYTFALNHLSYFMLTHLLLDTLKGSAPARIINVSSDAHTGGKFDPENLQSERGYNPLNAYSNSKLFNLLFTYELARRLQGTSVTVNALHPGFVASRFGKGNPGLRGSLVGSFMTLLRPIAISEKRGAETSIYLASSPAVANVTGMYFYRKQITKSSPKSYDVEAAQQLWNISAKLIGTNQNGSDTA